MNITNANKIAEATAANGPSVLAFASAALVSDTRRLAQLIDQTSDQDIAATLSRSQILVAGAALEALLSECAFQLKSSIYQDQKNFRVCGVPGKYKKLGLTCPEAISELWQHRNALVHSEPDNERSLKVSDLITASAKIAEIIEQEAITVWGQDMPDWFTQITGLKSKA